MARQKDIVINQWREGNAQSPLEGYGMRNVDIEDVSGAVKINYKTSSNSMFEYHQEAYSDTFTADDTTNRLTLNSAVTWEEGTPVKLTTTGTLPAPLSTDTVYYVEVVSTTSVFLSATYDGAINSSGRIDITDTGTGTHTITAVNVGLPMYFENGGTTDYFIDNHAVVWAIQDSNAWELLCENDGVGNGFILWKDHLIIAEATKMNAYRLSDGTFTENFFDAGNLFSTSNHTMHIGADDRVYIANGRYVSRISEDAGQNFDASNAATYTTTLTALTLPEGELIKSIVTLGVDLMIGTDQSLIYRWDRNFNTYFNPIKVEAGPIDAMILLNNKVYVFPSGTTTNFADIYVTDGNLVNKIASIPRYLIGEARTGQSPKFWNGAIYIKNGKIYFSVGGQGNGDGFVGLWSLTETGILNFEHQNAQGEVGSDAVLLGGATEYFLCYLEGSTDYMDDISTSLRYTNYVAYIESPLIRVGTANQMTTYRQFDIYLTGPLATGEGIRLKVRDDRNASYSTIDTFDFSTHGAKQKYSFDYFFEGENLQVKAELTTGGSSSSTPELIEIRIR